MKKILFIIPVFFAFGIKAQDTEMNDLAGPKQFVTTIPVRCIMRDANIGYGFALTPRHTLEFRGGFVHRNLFLHEYYEKWLASTEMNFAGPSLYVQLNKWETAGTKNRYYWGIIAGYRYLSYHDRSIRLTESRLSSISEEVKLSQWRNDFLLLFTIGYGTTKVSTSEISLGFRVMQTHTHVVDTRYHADGMTEEEYDDYKSDLLDEIPNSRGITIGPILRITSRFGWFSW